jgi:acetyl esterase/lipase
VTAAVAAQRIAARTLLSLPAPILRLMAGGGVAYQGGRTLDPRLQFLAAQARNHPPISTLSPDLVRRAEAAALEKVAGDAPRDVRCAALTVPGAAGDLPGRLYLPAKPDPAMPLIVWAHMGGGVIGSLDTSHAFAGLLAAVVRAPVVSVDYRLAPEHRFPAGLEDMLAAYRWALEAAGRHGASGAAIGGDSMGANFATVVCQELKRLGEPQPRLQILLYPCTDVASEAPSMATYADAFPLSARTMDWFMGHYIGAESDPADPRLSPLKAASLEGLAPAVIATAGFDPLLDQGEAYVRRLREAGVPLRYRSYDSLCHAFAAFTGTVPAAGAACHEITTLVRDMCSEETAR